MMKLRLGGIKWLAQGLIAGKQQNSDSHLLIITCIVWTEEEEELTY